jgi:ABC-type sugar transport system ATPase subunit
VKTEEDVLKFENITKSFPGVLALDDVSFSIKRGSVHAVVGENGAGKSTLMKILLGIYHPDSGKILFQNRPAIFRSPKEALHAGIAMIHQELSSALDLTVYQNIFLGKELTRKKTPFLSKKQMRDETLSLLEYIGISDIDPNAYMRDLSVAKQQMCEIAKAISYNAEVILMDEPTSAIADKDIDILFSIIRKLVSDGKTIVYVSHKMDEIFAVTENVSVFRDGKHIETLATDSTDRDHLINLMVGRRIEDLFPKEFAEIGDIQLRVEHLSREDEFEDISFDVKQGEILGVAGLMGAGRSEIMETLFGIRKKTRGEVYVRGVKVEISAPSDAIKHKIAFLTEDRKNSGCFLPLSVSINICIASIGNYVRYGLLSKRKIDESTLDMISRLSIKTPSTAQKVMNLSGGNQQKILVGRWLLTEPEILIVDEPTRGIDVGAKAEIHKLLVSLAKKGKSIIMISSEMPEVLAMSDRILVINSGKAAAVLDARQTSQEEIMKYCTLKTS